ncbi:uncharacterized, partial [Tachysurus ichikawai]
MRRLGTPLVQLQALSTGWGVCPLWECYCSGSVDFCLSWLQDHCTRIAQSH